MAGNTSKYIWWANSASNTPWNNTDNIATGGDWTAGVSHAHTLAVSCECTDGVVKNSVGIGDTETVTTVSVCECLQIGELEIVGCTAGIL